MWPIVTACSMFSPQPIAPPSPWRTTWFQDNDLDNERLIEPGALMLAEPQMQRCWCFDTRYDGGGVESEDTMPDADTISLPETCQF